MSSEQPDRRGFGHEIRWTLIVVVVAVLGAVALWPRGEDPSSGTDPRPGAAERSRPGVDTLRQRADLAGCVPPSGTGTSTAARDSPLSGVTGTCLGDGSRTDLAETLAGRTTLVNVWATWCPPCREELPALQEYSEQPNSVRVVGLQVQSRQEAGLELLDGLNVRLPVLHAKRERVAEALPAPRPLPASYLVTPEGRVERLPPEVFESPEQIRRAVDDELEAR
ncbi:TlpA family protein disulfide reductase [Actinopolyspora saharensis]|uniref:Thiol-disulfide isomerase or thioredoxin n=1 Tax=Actinopolyspora saharensis TaxID=995062 RepID=A0A1H1F907_9ACTN|nr:TlpA disulfide reductase family protein [Actinopolyspora saharensis]SDQ97533.1 Thiol-disulfide isomerase or thioredoxin [Actinopolyspora saharensis]